jgi:uncharacterized membrane protein
VNSLYIAGIVGTVVFSAIGIYALVHLLKVNSGSSLFAKNLKLSQVFASSSYYKRRIMADQLKLACYLKIAVALWVVLTN